MPQEKFHYPDSQNGYKNLKSKCRRYFSSKGVFLKLLPNTPKLRKKGGLSWWQWVGIYLPMQETGVLSQAQGKHSLSLCWGLRGPGPACRSHEARTWGPAPQEEKPQQPEACALQAEGAWPSDKDPAQPTVN